MALKNEKTQHELMFVRYWSLVRKGTPLVNSKCTQRRYLNMKRTPFP